MNIYSFRLDVYNRRSVSVSQKPENFKSYHLNSNQAFSKLQSFNFDLVVERRFPDLPWLELDQQDLETRNCVALTKRALAL